MIALVDACVVIDVLRGSEVARVSLAGYDDLVASEVTRFELLAGLRPGEEAATEGFIALPHWIPIDEGVARRAGVLKRTFHRAHSGIGDVDYIVAATALEYGAKLLTTNVRHFPMLEGLGPAY